MTWLPYPFGKFDFLLVPAFQFGGMEHPGAIFYNASGLMLDESATQNQQLERASVISHETAHMWFGDLVTMRWFTDVWMKEVFRQLHGGEDRQPVVSPSTTTCDSCSRTTRRHEVDRTEGTNAIRQPLANLSDAGTLYGNIIYDKAPIVMRQLETLLGPDPFRDGMREYLRRFAFGNATWSDLVAILDDKTPDDLASWSRAWVDERARPVITTALTIENGRIATLTLSQRDPYRTAGSRGARLCRWRSAIPIASSCCRSGSTPDPSRSRPRAACRRPCSCCRTAAASPTASCTSIPRACVAEHEASRDPDALTAAARGPPCGTMLDEELSAGRAHRSRADRCRARRRAQRPADARQPEPGTGGYAGGTPRRAGAEDRAHAAVRSGRGPDTEPEGFVFSTCATRR